MTAEAKEEEGGKRKRRWPRIVLGVLAVMVVLGMIVDACEGNVYDGCPKEADGSLNCSHQDLSGSDLRELDFSGADFSGANLNGADFYKADLWNANFSGANLKGADLNYTDLRNANLSGLDLSGGEMLRGADLSGADLSGANLKYTDLRNVNFSGANLKGADLQGADFAGGWRPDAKLTGANLEGATADTNTDWPGDFDWKAAGVLATTTTTTAAPTTVPKPTTTRKLAEVNGPHGVSRLRRSEWVGCHNDFADFHRHREGTMALANSESRKVDVGLAWYYLQLDLSGDYRYLLESMLECEDLFPEIFVLYIYTAIEQIDSGALLALYPSDRSVSQEYSDASERYVIAWERARKRTSEVRAWFKSLTD